MQKEMPQSYQIDRFPIRRACPTLGTSFVTFRDLLTTNHANDQIKQKHAFVSLKCLHPGSGSRRSGMAPGHTTVCLSQKPSTTSTKNGTIRPAILFLAWTGYQINRVSAVMRLSPSGLAAPRPRVPAHPPSARAACRTWPPAPAYSTPRSESIRAIDRFENSNFQANNACIRFHQGFHRSEIV